MVSEQEIINKLEVKILNVDDNNNVNAAILERLEKVVQSLQENSVKMGQLLAVCLLYTSPSPRDTTASRMPSSA